MGTFKVSSTCSIRQLIHGRLRVKFDEIELAFTCNVFCDHFCLVVRNKIEEIIHARSTKIQSNELLVLIPGCFVAVFHDLVFDL